MHVASTAQLHAECFWTGAFQCPLIAATTTGTEQKEKKGPGGIICCYCLRVIVATNSSPVAVAAAVTTVAAFSLFFCDHISQSGACQHLLTLCGTDTAIANSSFTLTR
ncbi:hypothetical protein TcCL_Unassigned03245 [Trypanosoma cruzi]|nr:hypothetical protein TcCL_Unassigned03245 [Trypanosoma cruzi]